MEKKKCCSIIVTYNRKTLLLRNVLKNLEQTVGQDILVINNASTDGTEQELKARGYLDNERVIYIENESNIFGSGAFHMGMEYVFSHDYDYAWLMDDDGYPLLNNSLQVLLEIVEKIENKSIILNSMVLCNNDNLSFGLNGISTLSHAKQIGRANDLNIIKDTINPFNGTLISKNTFEKIGNIRKDFMIHGDETEYILRAQKNNVYVASVVDSLFFHPRKAMKLFIYKGKIYNLRYTPYWMEYYEARNYFYIAKEYYEGRKNRQAIIDKSVAKIKNAPTNKIKYFFYIILGLIAGYRGDFKPLKRHRSRKGN